MSRRWKEEADDKKRRRGKSREVFRGFVTHTLTKADRKDYLKYEATEDFADDLLLRLVNEGYRLSLSVDRRNGSYMAAISTKDAESINNGLVLTARSGSNPFQAGMRAVFLHYVVFGEEWPDPSVTEEYQDEWEVQPD